MNLKVMKPVLKILLTELKLIMQNAYFKTSISLTIKYNQNIIFNGKIDGKISDKIKGEYGFGYDPILFNIIKKH